MSGMLSGGFWGLVVGGVAVVGSSLLTPPPMLDTPANVNATTPPEPVQDAQVNTTPEPNVTSDPVIVEAPVAEDAPADLQALPRASADAVAPALPEPAAPETGVAIVDAANPPAPDSVAAADVVAPVAADPVDPVTADVAEPVAESDTAPADQETTAGDTVADAIKPQDTAVDDAVAEVTDPEVAAPLDTAPPAVTAEIADPDLPETPESPVTVTPEATETTSVAPPATIETAQVPTVSEILLETDSAAQPDVAAAEGLSEPPATPEAVDLIASADDPVLPTPQGTAPQADVPETPVSVDTSVADEPVAQVAEEVAEQPVSAPETVDAPPLQEAPDVVVATEPEGPVVEEDAPDAPAEDETEVVSLAQSPVVTVLPSGTGNVRVNRLTGGGSTIAPASDAVVSPEDETAETPEESAGASEDLSAFARYAATYENPEGLPEIAVVLIDDGILSDAVTDVAGIGFPVSVMLNPAAPDAEDRMRAYRRVGIEVGLLATLPPAATASDVAVFYEAALANLPEAIAVLDFGSDGPANTDIISQTAMALAEDGRGLITVPRGLNTAQRVATEAGLPSGTIARFFDENGEDARVIQRFMDQAAFRARQETGVIMLGQVRPETITALTDWADARRAGQVAIVPVSAVMSQPE